MDWDDVRFFLALARSGSVRAAGTSLGVSHSTVARRVEALEARLCTRLFDRNRDGYSVTDAGHEMFPAAERVEREMATLERGLVGQDERLSGKVAVTCCDHYVAELLMRELAPFLEEHREIELTFTTDSRSYDLSKREADIAIRALAMGQEPPEYLIGQKVAPITVANYVAVAHASRLDPELAGVETRWVSFEERKFHDVMVAAGGYPDVPSWGSFSSLELMVEATIKGLGIAMLPTYAGDQRSELRRLAQPDLRHVAELWLLCHPDLRDNARIRATRRRIADALKRHAPLFVGEPVVQ